MDPDAIAAMLQKQMGTTSVEETKDRFSKLSEEEGMAVFFSAMQQAGPDVDPMEIIKQEVLEKPNVLLSEFRNRPGRPPFTQAKCSGCAKGSIPMKRCTACKAVWYCSKACQIKDWKIKGALVNRPHKYNCPEIVQVKREFASSPNGMALRKKFLWADQHDAEGAFYVFEFLVRRGVRGTVDYLSFWDRPSILEGTFVSEGNADKHGFQNGQMLLQNKFPSLHKGWVNLSSDEYPSGDPPTATIPPGGIKSWPEYMEFRDLSYSSIAPLLLTNVLTIYQMLHHELSLTNTKKITVALLGVESEVNQIPLFGELAHLLPSGCELELVLLSPSVKAMCRQGAQSPTKPPSIISSSKDHVVLDKQSTTGRVRVRLDAQHGTFHETGYWTPDAVIGLNAGLSTYPAWSRTMVKILALRIPFSFSDHSYMQQRSIQKGWVPRIVEAIAKQEGTTSLPLPRLDISLNPFHSIANRDAAPVQVPNLENGYLMTWDGKSYDFSSSK